MQILPPKELSKYIKHYLFLERDCTDIQKLRLFSDGNTGIVFSLKNKLISDFSDSKSPVYLPNSFLYGQLNGFKDIYSGSSIEMIIVVFHPNGINQLLGVMSSELKESILSIDILFGKEGAELHEKLNDQINIQDKLFLLNQFFRKLDAKKPPTNQVIANAALDFISKNKGLFSLQQLVNYTGYTEKHIERKFKECIGLNPKKFGNIIKLHYFLKLLEIKTPNTNLTSVSYQAGFADQSHLIKEFKKQTGITPTEYLSNKGKLTNNFIANFQKK